MVDILIKGGTVITMDLGRRVIVDGAIVFTSIGSNHVIPFTESLSEKCSPTA